MKLTIPIKFAASLLLLLLSQILSAQEQLIKVPSSKITPYTLKAPKTDDATPKTLEVSSCIVDTVLYPYYKELAFAAPDDSFFIDAMVGNVRSASQAYHLDSKIEILGVQFWGAAYTITNTAQTHPVRAYLYLVDAQNKPLQAIDSADVIISERYQFYNAIFDSPRICGSNFAVAVRSILHDTLAVMVNNAGNTWHDPSYGESLAWRRYGSGTWNTVQNFFLQDLEYMIFPIVDYSDPEVDFTGPAEGCINSSLNFTGNSSSLFENPMFNLLAYDVKWHNKTDTTFEWDFGDGTATVNGSSATHIYTAPGTYTITLKGTILGYYTRCNFIKTKEITISPLMEIEQQPQSVISGCPGNAAQFTVSASGENISYEWQEKAGDSFVPVTGEPFSGYNTATLSISEGNSLSSSTFRVQLTGNCTGTITSDEVTFMAADVTDPEFTECPGDTNITSATYSYELPLAIDNCSDVIVSLTEGLAPDSEFPFGETTVTYEAEDQSGNMATCSFTVTRNMVNSTMNNADLIAGIYPNPASEYVQVAVRNPGTSEISIQVMNIEGMVIVQNTFSPSSELKVDIADLSKGIYYIVVQTGNLRQTGKLIVE